MVDGSCVPNIQNMPSTANVEAAIASTLTRYGSSGLRCNYLINIDKLKISQVVRNLLSNALKFTPRGGRVTVTATVILVAPVDHNHSAPSPSRGLEASHECFLSPPYFRFEVTDTGPGVSKVSVIIYGLSVRFIQDF